MLTNKMFTLTYFWPMFPFPPFSILPENIRKLKIF